MASSGATKANLAKDMAASKEKGRASVPSQKRGIKSPATHDAFKKQTTMTKGLSSSDKRIASSKAEKRKLSEDTVHDDSPSDLSPVISDISDPFERKKAQKRLAGTAKKSTQNLQTPPRVKYAMSPKGVKDSIPDTGRQSKKLKLSEEVVVDESSSHSSFEDLDNRKSSARKPTANPKRSTSVAKRQNPKQSTSAPNNNMKDSASSSEDEPLMNPVLGKRVGSLAQDPPNSKKRKSTGAPTEASTKAAPKKPRQSTARGPRGARNAPAKATSSPASDASAAWSGELNRSIVNDVYPQLQHYVSEIEQAAAMIKQAKSLDEDLQTPVALAILQKLKERDGLLVQIKEKKENLSKGILKESDPIQVPLLKAFRAELGDEPCVPNSEDITLSTGHPVSSVNPGPVTEKTAEDTGEPTSMKEVGTGRACTLRNPSLEPEEPVTPANIADTDHVATLGDAPPEIEQPITPVKDTVRDTSHDLQSLLTGGETDPGPHHDTNAENDNTLGVPCLEKGHQAISLPIQETIVESIREYIPEYDIDADHVPTPGGPYSHAEEEEELLTSTNGTEAF